MTCTERDLGGIAEKNLQIALGLGLVTFGVATAAFILYCVCVHVKKATTSTADTAQRESGLYETMPDIDNTQDGYLTAVSLSSSSQDGIRPTSLSMTDPESTSLSVHPDPLYDPPGHYVQPDPAYEPPDHYVQPDPAFSSTSDYLNPHQLATSTENCPPVYLDVLNSSAIKRAHRKQQIVSTGYVNTAFSGDYVTSPTVQSAGQSQAGSSQHGHASAGHTTSNAISEDSGYGASVKSPVNKVTMRRPLLHSVRSILARVPTLILAEELNSRTQVKRDSKI